MKKILLVLLAAIMIISHCSCGGSGSNQTSEQDEVKKVVKNRLEAKILVSYDTVGTPTITYYLDKSGSSRYNVSGKVTVKDKYGDSFTGKYDAVVDFDSSTSTWKVTSCNLDTPTKDK